MKGRVVTPAELTAIAKECRKASGKSQTEAARELGVSAPTMFQAEEIPRQGLHKLRKRIIEAYSNFEITGPVYLMKRKRRSRST